MDRNKASRLGPFNNRVKGARLVSRDTFEMNLKPFNDCVNRPGEGTAGMWSARPSSRAFYYRDARTTESSASALPHIFVPMFKLNGIGGDGHLGLDRLISRAEFNVVTMVCALAHRFGVELRLDAVSIFVGSEACGFLSDGRPWTEVDLGIVIFGEGPNPA